MVARRIALMSGLDYAIMSGGDLGPLGQSAVSEMHLLLAWAKSSPKGLLLFVDEVPGRGARSQIHAHPLSLSLVLPPHADLHL